MVDAGNPTAEDQIKAVNLVLKEIGCADKATLLVLNKVDRVQDRSYLDVLMKHHPRAVCISAATGQGIDELREAVIECLSEDFAEADIMTSAANGKVLSFLAAHAEIFRQEYLDDRVHIRCNLPRHLLHHIEGPDVEVRLVKKDEE